MGVCFNCKDWLDIFFNIIFYIFWFQLQSHHLHNCIILWASDDYVNYASDIGCCCRSFNYFLSIFARMKVDILTDMF